MCGNPFGPAVAFAPASGKIDEGDGEMRYGTRQWRQVFQRSSPKEDRRGNCLESMESLFSQLMSYDRYAQSTHVFSGFHAGPGRQVFGADRRCYVDVTLVLPPSNRCSRPQVLFANFHGSYFHQWTPHEPDCPRNTRGMDEACWEDLPQDPLAQHDVKTLETRRKDRFNTRYAEAMSAVGRLLVTYGTWSECQLFHRDSVLSHVDGQRYKNVRTLLKKVHHEQAVLGITPRRMTLEKILKKLLLSDEEKKARRSDFSGFVVLHNGAEKTEDNAAFQSVGFCLQRVHPKVEELGAFTIHQQEMELAHHGGTRQGFISLEDRCKSSRQTMTKTSFHGEGETLSAAYLRFLVRDRKLEGYTISHFVFVRERDFLTKYIDELLQKRHEVKLLGGSSLESDSVKLLLNSLFGFSSMSAANHAKTTIYLESTLAKSSSAEAVRQALSISLLGCVRRPGKPPQLLYSLTRKMPQARVQNLIQNAAMILSRSREIFFSKLALLLHLLRNDSCQLLYCDTDSVYVTLSDACLANIMEDRFKAEADKHLARLLNDGMGERHGAGFFKVEGLYLCIYVRAIKCYILRHRIKLAKITADDDCRFVSGGASYLMLGGDQDTAKMKSIPK